MKDRPPLDQQMFLVLIEAVEWAERVCEPPDWPSWLHEAHALIKRIEGKA